MIRIRNQRTFACARGLALFIAGFCALNVLSYFAGNSANQNGWWIDMSVLPTVVAAALQLLIPVFLIWFVVSPRVSLWRCIVTVALCAIIALLAASNVYAFYTLLAQGSIKTSLPLPFSFFICLLFIYLALRLLYAYRIFANFETVPPQPRPLLRLRTIISIAITFVIAAAVFPVMQILCFGFTDYRQPVDAAIVLGAQVYPDGRLSHALEERVDAGIQLYEQGYTPTLIMSGGIDVDNVSEAAAMRDYAVEHGVPSSAILLDPKGNSTEATATNTTLICKRYGFKNVGVVSSFYHLPRIKQVFLGEGLDVYTVPATITHYESYLVFSVVREIPGWWLYWLKGLVV